MPLLIGLAVIGVGVTIWLGYGAALLRLLPLLLFAACPLMHLFMHRHGHASQPAETKPVEIRTLSDKGRG